MANLDKIFDSITKTLFKDKFVLQANYTPETIPYREEQIEQIAAILAPCLRVEKVSNIFVYGKTGTGKTLSIQYVKNELLRKAREMKTPLEIVYLNCKLKKIADTEYRILTELIRKFGKDMPSTGLPTNTLYQRFVEIIDNEKKMILIVLDEIDQAVKRIGDEFLYNLTRLNSELTKSQISLIGISNDLVFIDNLDPRVRSSLGEEELVFPPYNAIQLQKILADRSSKAFEKTSLGNGVLEKCAALAAREHGDARRALDLLRIAAELADRDGNSKVELNHIDKANEKIEKDKVITLVETQPKQFHLTLLSIIRCNNKQELFFTGDVYNVYQELCKKTKIEPLTQRRVSDIIGEFDLFGIINARVVSKGRYGRTKEIKLNLPQNLVLKIYKIVTDSLGI